MDGVVLLQNATHSWNLRMGRKWDENATDANCVSAWNHTLYSRKKWKHKINFKTILHSSFFFALHYYYSIIRANCGLWKEQSIKMTTKDKRANERNKFGWCDGEGCWPFTRHEFKQQHGRCVRWVMRRVQFPSIVSVFLAFLLSFRRIAQYETWLMRSKLHLVLFELIPRQQQKMYNSLCRNRIAIMVCILFKNAFLSRLCSCRIHTLDAVSNVFSVYLCCGERVDGLIWQIFEVLLNWNLKRMHSAITIVDFCIPLLLLFIGEIAACGGQSKRTV